MTDLMNQPESLTNIVCIRTDLTHDTDDGGMGLRSNPPDMQVRDSGIARFLDQFANFLGNVRIGLIQ